MNRRTFLAAAVSATMLTGCAVGPDYNRPYVPVPKDYRHVRGEETDVNLLKARWWTEYHDPNLDFFVSKAIANNRTLQQTMANVERAAAALTTARANLFPQLNYSGDLGKSKASLNTPTGAAMGDKPIKSYEVLATASWEIDLWGKIRRQTESAQASLRATEAAHRAAISSVIGSVISTYLSILMTEEQYKTAKKYGFQDKTIKRLAQVDTLPVENYRAGFKMVDTCAAEFSANTPYFYSTYDGDNEAAEFIAEKEAEASAKGEPKKKKVLVFGSGPIRIGQGIEFDYCSVHCVWTLKNHGCEAILVNNNPETVSTDFDTGDRLYFDPLNPESVDNIIATEKPDACVVQFGGQTAIKLAKHMDEIGLPILGTPADAIDEAEDRERFDELLERCRIPRAPGRTVFNLDEALAAADEIGLPVLMRPSYVLGGQNMIVAYTKADVIEYMGVITEHVDMDHPVLLDKYILGTECEVDAICDGENFLIPGIMEQVERTGVHSGDSICVYPAQHLTQAEIDTMVDYTGRFARELHVTGLVNVQYAVSNGKVYVIEVNPRSSRTVPYISKVTGVPMVDLAVRCCLGEKLADMGYGTGLHPNAPYVAVKVPVFSFEKLHGVDTQFGPEMKSTGEVLGIAPNYHDALLKGLIGAGYTFKTPGPASCCIFTVKDSDKPEFVDIAWKLKSMGYKLYGTSGTCAWLNKHMVPCNEVRNMSGESPNIVDLLQSGLVDYVFSTSAKGRDPKRDSVRLRRKAVELSIPCITAVDTANALVDCLRSDHSLENIPLVDIATLYHRK